MAVGGEEPVGIRRIRLGKPDHYLLNLPLRIQRFFRADLHPFRGDGDWSRYFTVEVRMESSVKRASTTEDNRNEE
jgi:hypothetical protein